jgi:hypothetical protein
MDPATESYGSPQVHDWITDGCAFESAGLSLAERVPHERPQSAACVAVDEGYPARVEAPDNQHEWL